MEEANNESLGAKLYNSNEQIASIVHKLYQFKDTIIYVNGVAITSKKQDIILYKDLLKPKIEFEVISKVEFENHCKEISEYKLKRLID